MEGKNYTMSLSNKWQLSNWGIEPTSASIGVRFKLEEQVLKIQTVYHRYIKRRIIKIYSEIAKLAIAREPSAKAKKCKNDVTDTPGIEHAPLHGRDVCVSIVPIFKPWDFWEPIKIGVL